MASIHLGGTRSEPAWTQENNAQLAWNSYPSPRSRAQIPIILLAFLRLSFFVCPQQQGPVLKILRSVACQQGLRKMLDLDTATESQVHMTGTTFFNLDSS